MPHPVWNRETLLDLTVNVVPLVILAFFFFLFLFFSPWAPNTFIETISLGLILVPFVLLGLLTWVAAHYL
ncbi:DUF6684 family protein [Haladaptatus sp. NG-WS-4]